MKQRLKAYYSGKVQGVGFRFTVREIAQELKITGWVKNLSDGRVEIVAESEEEVLKDFLVRVNSSFARYIQGTDIKWLAVTDEFKEFGIRLP